LSNPYSTDVDVKVPYGKSDRSGGIDIRGICYAMNKYSASKLFPLPKKLVMWFSDFG